MRSGWQMLAKALVGRLKVLASGQEEERNNTAEHYTGLLTNLRDHPEWLLDDAKFLDARRSPEIITGGVVHDARRDHPHPANRPTLRTDVDKGRIQAGLSPLQTLVIVVLGNG